MFIEDKLYSANEVSGGRDIDDRLYSKVELEFMESLFSEYYESQYEFYQEDVDTAYADFYDAYSSGPRMTEYIDKAKERVPTGDPTLVRSAATVAGAGAGFLASKLINKKKIARRKELTKKVNRGEASKSDLIELSNLNKQIKKTTLASTAVGAGVGLGGTILASRLNRSKKKDSNNSSEDTYASSSQLGAMAGSAVRGAALGAILTQLITSFGNDADRRRFLKNLRTSGKITEKESEELMALVRKRTKQKYIGAGVGLGGTILASRLNRNKK